VAAPHALVAKVAIGHPYRLGLGLRADPIAASLRGVTV
jgi:hypothetical protein